MLVVNLFALVAINQHSMMLCKDEVRSKVFHGKLESVYGNPDQFPQEDYLCFLGLGSGDCQEGMLKLFMGSSKVLMGILINFRKDLEQEIVKKVFKIKKHKEN
ncbi:hypothetical protein C5167_046712, partial [Papaver somniferum]